MLVKETDEVAKLRLLLVEPKARGLGIGTRLVEECMRFARAPATARSRCGPTACSPRRARIYEQAGFKLVDTNTHDEFGHELVGETWNWSCSLFE